MCTAHKTNVDEWLHVGAFSVPEQFQMMSEINNERKFCKKLIKWRDGKYFFFRNSLEPSNNERHDSNIYVRYGGWFREFDVANGTTFRRRSFCWKKELNKFEFLCFFCALAIIDSRADYELCKYVT